MEHHKVIIAGAGIAGIMAARRLVDAGIDTLLIEKLNRSGGRISTQTIGEACVDSGPQFLAASSSEFQFILDQWEARGIVRPWIADPDNSSRTLYSGIACMGSMVRKLSKDLPIDFGRNITSVYFEDDRWHIVTSKGVRYSADHLIITAPPPAALFFMDEVADVVDEDFFNDLAIANYIPGITLVALLAGPSGIEKPGVIHPNDETFIRISDNYIRGLSEKNVVITAQASPGYSFDNFYEKNETILEELTFSLSKRLNSSILISQVQKNRFGYPGGAIEKPFLAPANGLNLYIAGDSFGRPGNEYIENAVLSGLASSEEVLKRIQQSISVILP